MRKLAIAMIIALTVSTFSMTVYAEGAKGTWRKDNVGWWYELYGGGYYSNAWFQDNNLKWYYFNGAGYMAANQWIGDYYLGSDGAMLTNTKTPDGYMVDYSGKWINSKSNEDDIDLNNGTYTFDLSQADGNYGIDYYSAGGDYLLISGHMYRDSDNKYVGYKTLSYRFTKNTRYRTKYKLSYGIEVMKDQFVDFYKPEDGQYMLTFTVEDGDVTEIMIYQLRE